MNPTAATPSTPVVTPAPVTAPNSTESRITLLEQLLLAIVAYIEAQHPSIDASESGQALLERVQAAAKAIQG